MYLAHFGLERKPFDVDPDPDFLYLTDQHRSALAVLEYGVYEQTGITVVSGEVGAGKTTLLRYVLENMPDTFVCGFVRNANRTYGTLVSWICRALDLPQAGADQEALYRTLDAYLTDLFSKERKVVIFIDEAHNLSIEDFEELKLLSNVHAGNAHLLKFVLVGQQELFDLLMQPALVQLAQRVTSEFRLSALSREETRGYIHHRLETAGGQAALFSDEAIDRIFEASTGVPRVVNTLCDHALALAYGASAPQVSAEIADEAARSRSIGLRASTRRSS